MAILLLVLAVNINALYSQNQSTIKSNASTPENVEKLLPSLPPGCIYQHANGKVTVACPKATPTIAINVPINVALPELPPQCSYITSSDGSAVHCTAPVSPIPTMPVNLPSTCTITNEPNMITCTYGNNQTVTLPLPKLPNGCSYVLGGGKYYVVCEAKLN